MTKFEALNLLLEWLDTFEDKPYKPTIANTKEKIWQFLSKEEEALSVPDIRNKLTPISNLIAMLKSSHLPMHHDMEIHNLIVKEIEQCKISIEYLTQKSKK